jgi:hypothetical protein
MARLQSSETFNTGDVLTASALTNHVVNALPLPDFISLQTALTTPDSLDEFLVTDVSVPACKKVTLANIAGNLPATTVASLTVTTNATVNGNVTVNGNTTIGSNDSDTVTVNAESTFGGDARFDGTATFKNDVTLGELAEAGTYSRLDTVMTITLVDHGLTTGDLRWFNIENNQDYLGYYTVTVLTSSTFTITVVDDDQAPTTGNVYWYEKSTTLESPLAGAISGTPAVSLISTTDAYGDKVLIQDASDSDKLKVVAACLPKAWACISTKTTDTTTVSITNGGVRSASSNVLTITYAGHGFKVGDVIYLNLNGTAEDGWYDIKTVPDANTFTVQTAATTALTTNVSWYALTVNGFGISSAFKESAGSNIVNVNFTVPFTSVNYAPQIGFINQAASTAGTYVCVAGIINDTGLGSLNKTVNNFAVKITPAYTNGAENEGQLTLSVFGNI